MSRLIRTLSIFGTRPEAIKMAPVLKALDNDTQCESLICVTGQHREMLDQVLDIFDLNPDFDLNLMQPGQSLSQLTSRLILALEPVIREAKPDIVLVHGDTATTAAASLAAYYQSIPLAHVEAGLRTRNIYSPWPEEINRRVAGVIAAYHFAPTQTAKANLLSENVEARDIFVTGNTVIDALFIVLKKLQNAPDVIKSIQDTLPDIDPSKNLIVMTGHRRESFGKGFENICRSLIEISKRPDVQIIFPVHLNPYVKDMVQEHLAGHNNIHLIQPLGYLDFVYLMGKAKLIITDSGGIQEEAPALGVPVLVTRQTTERPEAIMEGSALLVGQETTTIVEATFRLLDDEAAYAAIANKNNPYGDGTAATQIVSVLKRFLTT